MSNIIIPIELNRRSDAHKSGNELFMYVLFFSFKYAYLLYAPILPRCCILFFNLSFWFVRDILKFFKLCAPFLTSPTIVENIHFLAFTYSKYYLQNKWCTIRFSMRFVRGAHVEDFILFASFQHEQLERNHNNQRHEDKIQRNLKEKKAMDEEFKKIWAMSILTNRIQFSAIVVLKYFIAYAHSIVELIQLQNKLM